MNWQIDHSPLPDYIRAALDGKPTLEDYQTFWSEIIGSENWRPGTAILKDIRNREPLGTDGYEIVRGIAEYLTSEKDRVGKSMLAIVANAHDGYSYGRVLEYAVRIRNSGMLIRTFGDESSAIQWLGQSRQ
jgi:hypothetical protein